MGEEPSQQPPDWWNSTGPCSRVRTAIRSSAAPVATTRGGAVVNSAIWAPRWTPSKPNSEEPELLGAVADQQVLGLLIMVQHHLVGLAADARLLIAAKRRVGRIGMVAVGPHPTRLDGAAEAVAAVGVAAPDSGAEAVEGVVGDRQGFGLVLEGSHRHHRPEDLLLKHAHLVVALEHGRPNVVAAGEVVLKLGLSAADQDLGALLTTDVEIAENLLQLFAGGLGPDHGRRIQRIALDDRGHTLECALYEPLIDAFLNQGAAGARAHLALVEREHDEALDGLVEEVVILSDHIVEENVR